MINNKVLKTVAAAEFEEYQHLKPKESSIWYAENTTLLLVFQQFGTNSRRSEP